MNDPLTIQQRIIDICKLMILPTSNPTPQAAASEDECSFATDDLPVFIVKRGRLLRVQRIAVDTLQETREYMLELFVEPIEPGTRMDAEEIEQARAADCLLPVLLFFGARPQLELEPFDEALVEQAMIPEDSAATRRFTREKAGTYAGARFPMQVITRHLIT